jgi:ankyrin repeat protein
MQHKNITLFFSCLLLSLSSQATPTGDLFVALGKGDAAGITAAIKAKADVNARDDDGHSPLTLATLKKNSNAIAELVEAGAKIDDLNDLGLAPIHVAAGNGLGDQIATIIAQKANVDLASRQGQTAAQIAAEAGHYDMLDRLNEEGAGMNMLKLIKPPSETVDLPKPQRRVRRQKPVVIAQPNSLAGPILFASGMLALMGFVAIKNSNARP